MIHQYTDAEHAEHSANGLRESLGSLSNVRKTTKKQEIATQNQFNNITKENKKQGVFQQNWTIIPFLIF